MSHARRADKLLIKPAAGARPAPPHTRGQIIPKAHTKWPVTRRVTRGTATTRLADAPDRHPRRVSQSLERRIPLGLLWLVELEQELAERCEALWAEPLRPGSLDIGDCRPYRVDGSDAS